MPIYEYRCPACEGVTSVFLRSMRREPPADQRCEHCGGGGLSRVMPRVTRLRTGEDAAGEYGAPGEGGEYRDPRQIGRWVEQRFGEYGLDLPGETREMIDAAREGELPGDIAG